MAEMERPDVFISYAHLDDEGAPSSEELEQFATYLIKRLGAVGKGLYGRMLNIWSDKDIQAGEVWEFKISHAISSCQVFIPIVSPAWVRSGWCAREWRVGWQRSGAEGSGENQSFILPVSFEWN